MKTRLLGMGPRTLGRLLVVALWLFATSAMAEEAVAVVTGNGSGLSGLSSEQISALFLGEARFMNGSAQVVPLDQKDEGARRLFYSVLSNRTLIQVRAHWARMVFTGNGRPPKQLGVAELVRILRENPNVVTYLPLSRAGGFRVLMTIRGDS